MKSAALFILSTLLAGNALAQTASAPFDRRAAQLPPRYAGSSLNSIVKQLQKIAPRKTDESENDFAKRASALKVQGPRAFVLPDIPMKYDAEQQILRLTIPQYEVPVGNSHQVGLVLVERNQAEHPLNATLPVGASVRISRETTVTTNLLFARSAALSDVLSDPDDVTISVAVPRDTAPRLRRDLRVLVVCDDLAAETVAGHAHLPPTGESPTEYFEDATSLRATTPVEYWVYNFETGEIVGRFTESGTRIEH